MIGQKSRRAVVCCPPITVMAAEAGFRSGATLSGLLCSFLILLAGVFPDATESADPGDARLNTSEAIERLSQVFGLEKVPTHTHHRSPPEYMLDLYNSVAYNDGITKTAAPYDADVVRGFPDRAASYQMQFKYNVSYIGDMENILEAEFHLYKLRPDWSQYPLESKEELRKRRRRQQRAAHFIELKLYRILKEDDLDNPDNLQILEIKRISAYGHGWHTFKVTGAVKQWVNETAPNHGFLVTASGDANLNTTVRFAQRNQHHDSKQPVLLVFTEDEEYRLNRVLRNEEFVDTSRQKYVQFMNEDYRAQFRDASSHGGARYMPPQMHKELSRGVGDVGRGRKRLRRAAEDSSEQSYYKKVYNGRRKKRACQRQELYVDFVKIGWSGWIISPKGFNAYHCKGTCPFPLGQNQKPTNHATVQSIVHALRIEKDVSQPCCVPNKLYPISLLYFDDDENVILKQYDDMVATSCGCH